MAGTANSVARRLPAGSQVIVHFLARDEEGPIELVVPSGHGIVGDNVSGPASQGGGPKGVPDVQTGVAANLRGRPTRRYVIPCHPESYLPESNSGHIVSHVAQAVSCPACRESDHFRRETGELRDAESEAAEDAAIFPPPPGGCGTCEDAAGKSKPPGGTTKPPGTTTNQPGGATSPPKG